MKLRIIQNRKYYYIFSGVLLLISILSLIAWGLKPGLDFSGGSLMEVSFSASRPENQAVLDSLKSIDLGDLKIQTAGERGIILRFKNVDEDVHQQALSTLRDTFKDNGQSQVSEERFESIGPVIGSELKKKSWWAISLAALMIIIYIAYAFRHVSRPVVSWKYGVVAVVALIHDITIVVGAFSVLGHFMNIEVDALFITALLTILGFSVHDTIVVFDRTRENLSRRYSGDFEEVVNDSVNQTISRSINTSLTTVLVLSSLFILGGVTTKNFVLALIMGIIIGTYSSIFIASTLIVDWHRIDKRLAQK